MEHSQIQKINKKNNILIWILASILLHFIIVLIIKLYTFKVEPDLTANRMINKHDRVMLMTSPMPHIAKAMPQVQPQPKAKPKQQPKQKEEEPQFDPKKLAKIVAGKQGIDQQNVNGIVGTTQTEITHETKEEKNIPETIEKTQKEKQKPQFKPLDLSNYVTRMVSSVTQQPQETESPAPKQKQTEEQQYQNVPKSNNPIPNIKSMSFKDIGLGFNNKIATFGNSAHMSINGYSPDIPQGQELKYLTYLNQMADMIVTSMYANPKSNMIHRTHEQIVFWVKVDRAGKLLDTKVTQPSKHSIMNTFLIDSVKLVGLFNQLPKFITKDTFEIYWIWRT